MGGGKGREREREGQGNSAGFESLGSHWGATWRESVGRRRERRGRAAGAGEGGRGGDAQKGEEGMGEEE